MLVVVGLVHLPVFLLVLACVTWPLVGVVCVSLCCSVRFSCLFLCCFGLACFLLAASPLLVRPAPLVGPLALSGPVSFLLVPPSGYLVVSCDGPVVMPGGVECSNV